MLRNILTQQYCSDNKAWESKRGAERECWEEVMWKLFWEWKRGEESVEQFQLTKSEESVTVS